MWVLSPRRAALFIGPLVGLALVVLGKAGVGLGPLAPAALAMVGVTFWVALWWVAECMPIAATSLLPLLLLPVSGVLSSEQTAGTYMDRFIILMMAGFMAALALERWGLHRRLALWVLLRIGASPRRLVLGMLVASGFMSMWIANTAATLIMLPIALALIARLEPELARPDDPNAARRFATALLLAVAYGASIGGIATPLGTPPNLIYLGAVEKYFGSAPGFLEWMLRALPVAVLMAAFLYVYFVRHMRLAKAVPGQVSAGREVLLAEARALGPISPDEKRVAAIFLVMVILWVTRSVDLGHGQKIGWAPLLGLDKTVDDATVAILGTTLLFVWPSRTEPGQRLLDWPTARQIPWDVVLLFGGGLALAKGFDASGLSTAIVQGLSGLSALPPVLFMLVITAAVTFFTEVTSNTALTTLLMPILAPVAKASGLSPELVMLPAALSASCAFMLPVATPPNAVVYGTGRIPIGEMARTGLWLNLAGIAIITTWLTLVV